MNTKTILAHIKRGKKRKKKKRERGTFPHPFLHWDFVVVTNGVFTQEVELHHILLTIILWIQFDVFDS